MYKITIERIERQTVKESGKWVKVSDNNDKYGYAPDREVEREVNVKVLEQSVDELDLIAVIKAINGIGE